MVSSAFLATTIQLPSNAVKSLLFRFSAFLVELTITKLFSLIAFRNDAFTPYLIFSEPLPQKLLYIVRCRSFLVLSFLLLMTAGSLWDTMLWGLDDPGLAPHPHRVSADTLANHRHRDIPYTVTSRTAFGNIGALDIMSDLSAGLFDRVNVTLTGLVAVGQPEIAAKPHWKAQDGAKDVTAFPGARIYLDDEGWSVSIDLLIESTSIVDCPATYATVSDASWMCEFKYDNDTRRGADYLNAPFGVPDLWWSAAQGYADFEYISTDRATNIWSTLGKGGDTELMKMVLSITRGHRKHTFMVSAMKTTILALAREPVNMADVRDLVERTWRGGDGPALFQQDLDAIGKVVEEGSTGVSMGRQHTDGYKVTSRVYQLVSPFVGNTPSYTAFQILDANITLINSESVDQVPVPFEDCDTWYRNDAFGGVVGGTNCYVAMRLDGRTTVFQGEVDTMAVFVLEGTLGRKRASTAADALDHDAWRWIQEHDTELENLVLSRAYIVAGNAAAVMVDVNILRPAVSILQLLLVLLPVVTCAMSWGVVVGWVGWHYQSSLFSNVITTTHEGYDGEKPGYISKPPKLVIVRGGGKVYLATETGVFWHSGRGDGDGDRVPSQIERRETKPGALV